MFWIYLGSLQCEYCSIIYHWKAVIPLFQMWLWIYYNSHTYSHYIHCKHISSYSIILVISNPNVDFRNVVGYRKYSLSKWIIHKVPDIEIDDIWNKQWIVCYFLFSKHCIFAITQWFSYQYITYYIPLESFDFPLSNGIVVKVKFSHISYLLNCLFKYLIYLQCN